MSIKLSERRFCRLPDFDYSKAGAYFITICSKDRECLFGEVVNFRAVLSDLGRLVAKCWNDLPNEFPFVSLDNWVVMPNHFHGIIWLEDVKTSNRPIHAIIATFKARSTSQSKKWDFEISAFGNGDSMTMLFATKSTFFKSVNTSLTIQFSGPWIRKTHNRTAGG